MMMPGHVGFLPGAGLGGGDANYIQCWRSATERGRRSGETNTGEQDRTGFGVVQKHTFTLETELWQYWHLWKAIRFCCRRDIGRF